MKNLSLYSFVVVALLGTNVEGTLKDTLKKVGIFGSDSDNLSLGPLGSTGDITGTLDNNPVGETLGVKIGQTVEGITGLGGGKRGGGNGNGVLGDLGLDIDLDGVDKNSPGGVDADLDVNLGGGRGSGRGLGGNRGGKGKSRGGKGGNHGGNNGGRYGYDDNDDYRRHPRLRHGPVVAHRHSNSNHHGGIILDDENYDSNKFFLRRRNYDTQSHGYGDYNQSHGYGDHKQSHGYGDHNRPSGYGDHNQSHGYGDHKLSHGYGDHKQYHKYGEHHHGKHHERGYGEDNWNYGHQGHYREKQNGHKNNSVYRRNNGIHYGEDYGQSHVNHRGYGSRGYESDDHLSYGRRQHGNHHGHGYNGNDKWGYGHQVHNHGKPHHHHRVDYNDIDGYQSYQSTY